MIFCVPLFSVCADFCPDSMELFDDEAVNLSSTTTDTLMVASHSSPPAASSSAVVADSTASAIVDQSIM